MAPTTNSQFSVSWESHKSNVCSGFSGFQQNGEFVDMTIAADGYVVKVHKALIALASPYLKDIIRSASDNQHPIIYLNNVDYNTLCELLEYIYTGEVMVPIDNLTKFLETGKSLNIRGLEHVVEDVKHRLASTTLAEGKTKDVSPLFVKKSSITNKPQTTEPASTINLSNVTSMDSYQSYEVYEEAAVDMDDSDDDCSLKPQISPVTTTQTKKVCKQGLSVSMQFTVSTRGSLQMILNRYLYNLQWKSQSNTRRWRCVDYRHSRCQAYVITKYNILTNRGHPHNHGFHDKKILAKLESKAVFSTIDEFNVEKDTEEYTTIEDDFNCSDT